MTSNFGDALTPWLLKRLGNGDASWVSPGANFEHYLVTGSVLNWSSQHSVAWGPGLASWKDEVNPKADVRAFRGPLSLLRARSCGWKPGPHPFAIGDPALLLSKLLPPKDKTGALGIFPHYVDMMRLSMIENELREKGIVLIDPLGTVEKVAEQVSGCSRIMSSSLHGLIVADSYGVPSCWAKFGDSIGGDGMKFWDYLASVGRCTVEQPPEFLDLRNAGLDPISAALALPADRYSVVAPARLAAAQRSLFDTCPFIKIKVPA